jgi:hypothetical protein
VPAAEFCANDLIEIAHQRDLFQIEKVPLHELSEPFAEHRDGLSVSADTSKRHARDDATWQTGR